jgi:hypothetical protein
MELWEFLNQMKRVPRDQRPGQYAANLLCQVRPDLSEKVRGSLNNDPFYSDHKLQNFIQFVSDNWEIESL